MSLNQDARYSANDFYNIQYNNIKTEGSEITVLGDLIIQDIPDGTGLNEVLVVDSNNRVHKTIGGGGGGNGDVNGPSSSTNNSISLFDGTTGKMLKDSEAIYENQTFQIPTGNSYNIKNFNGVDNALQMYSDSASNSQFICFGCYIPPGPFQIISSSPAGQPVYYMERNFGTFNFKRNSTNNGPGSPLNINNFVTVWRANNSGFDVEDLFSLSNITNSTTNENVLVWNPVSGNVQWRDLSTNPINPFDQSLNTSDNVGFNEITTGTTNSFLLKTNEINAFTGSIININNNIKAQQIDSTLLQNSVGANLLIQSPQIFGTSLVAGSIDFSSATVTGLPTGGDVNGPSSSTDNAITKYDGTTGKIIQNSGVIIDDLNNLTTTGDLNANGCVLTGDISCNSVISDDVFTQNLVSNSLNNFDNSTTTFINSNVDFNGSTITNFPLGDVSSVATNSTLGQLAFFDDTTNKVINNSEILVNGARDITNINQVGCNEIFATNAVNCSGINTGLGDFQIGQNLTTADNVQFNSISTTVITTLSPTIFVTTPTQFNQGLTVVSGQTANLSNANVDLTGSNIIGKNLIEGTGTSNIFSIARYSDTTGKIIEAGPATINDSGLLTTSGIFAFDIQANNTVNFSNSISDFTGATIDFLNSTVFDFPANGIDTTNSTQDDTNRIFMTEKNGLLQKTEIRPVRATIFFSDNPLETTINTVNVWETFNVTIWTSNPTNIGTATSNQITILETQPGFIQVFASVSYRGSNTSNNIYQFGIFKNGVLIPCSTQKGSTTETVLEESVSMSCVVDYANSDSFDVRVRNRADIDNIFITDASFTVLRVWD